MGRSRTRSMLFAAAAALLAASAPNARAQGDAGSYPNKPVRVVVGFAPGGSNDIIARIVGEKLAASLGQPFVIENRPGAGAQVAASYVMNQPADGYTLLVGASGAMAVAPAVNSKLPYATLRDFAPVSLLGSFPLVVLVSANNPAKNVAELVEYAKANPDKSNYATSSASFTLTTELFKLRSGAPIQPIPYRGSNDAVLSVISEQTLLTFVDTLPAIPQLQGGKARALAITASKRLPELPNVPTMAEVGVQGMEITLWTGMFAPAGTPPEIIAKLEREAQRIMQLPDVQQRIRALATDPVGSSAADFAARIKGDIEQWTDVAKTANVKIEN